MTDRVAELRRAITLGLVGGVAVWHVSLVGMVETFDQRRMIGSSITFNYVLILGIALILGFVASRRAPEGTRSRLTAAAVAGLLVAALVVLLALFIDSFDVRRILVAATPRLVDILTFGQGLNLAGIMTSLLAFTAAGTAGGVLTVLPQSARRVLLTATVATLTVGLLADVIRVILPGAVARTLFAARALSITGAVIVFALTALIAVLHVTIQNSTMARMTGLRQARLVTGERRFVQAFGLAFVLTFPLWSRIFLSNTADMVGLYILMALGLNLVVGFAGLLDLGFVAFFAIGAYSMAVLTSPEIGVLNLGFWAALPIAIGAALLAGILLGVPVLRMRGDYLAIATLGFGEIVRLLVLSDWLRPHLGGAQGITRVGTPSIGSFSINSPQEFYYLILLGCVFAWFLSIRLKHSRIGRSWMAIREDEDVAQAMGINRVKSKLMAFAIGAALGGLAGAMFASLVGSVVPASFSLLVSINVLAVIIVGGMGSLPGVVVGALALVALPELFREFQEYRLLVYGAVLVAMMLFRPAGLWPEATREREIEETLEHQSPLPQHAPDVGRAVSD